MLGVDREKVEADPLGFARRAAFSYGAVVLLKGRHTLLARPDGQVRVTTSGVSWLAVAGAGDVLSGVIGSLLATGLESVRRRGRRLVAARRCRDPRQRGRAPDRECRGRRRAGRGELAAGLVMSTAPGPPQSPHARVVVDLAAIRHNIDRLRELVALGLERPPAVMVVVKADGYGHGMVQVAGAARAAGADWLGVATVDEALTLRAAGDSGRLLCWLAVHGADFAPLVAADVDVTAYSAAQVDDIVRGARETGRTGVCS